MPEACGITAEYGYGKPIRRALPDDGADMRDHGYRDMVGENRWMQIHGHAFGQCVAHLGTP